MIEGSEVVEGSAAADGSVAVPDSQLFPQIKEADCRIGFVEQGIPNPLLVHYNEIRLHIVIVHISRNNSNIHSLSFGD